MIKFIIISKYGSACVAYSTHANDINYASYNELCQYVGGHGEIRPTKIKGISVMYDDYYGCNAAPEDFETEYNKYASELSGNREFANCVLCRVKYGKSSDDEDEIVSLTEEDISDIKKYCVENSINLNWKD